MSETEETGAFTPERVRIIGLGASLVIFVVVLLIRFGYTPEEPRMPPEPPPPKTIDTQQVLETPEYYRGLLDLKADAFGVPHVTLEAMGEPFPYRSEQPGVVLKLGDEPLRVAGLELSAVVKRIEIVTTQGTYQRDHLVLHIENHGAKPLAYRVVTSVGEGEDKWSQKAEIDGNGLAIAPGETIERTECLLRSGARIQVDRVEVVELPVLGYHLLSQITSPTQMGLEPRTSRGHVPNRPPGCVGLPEQVIRQQLDSNQATWRDVVDFYARHDCEKYAFLPGYRAFERALQLPLPVTKATLARGR